MFESVPRPTSVDELAELLRSHPRLLAVGGQTKPSMSESSGATLVSMSGIRGMIEYEPSEFTFTARAGTSLREITDELSRRRQSLPFDPILVAAGATLGGTVASGIAGPGRFRYGGVRDFLLGAQVLLGDGRLVNTGGKVVKNAAGFDIPKLLVGSAGQFGVMTQLSFKVFPKPVATRTLRVSCESADVAIARISQAANSRWELDAIDYRHDESALWLRLAGPEAGIGKIAETIHKCWPDDCDTVDAPETIWATFNELRWAEGSASIVRIPITLSGYHRWRAAIGCHRQIHEHLSAGGGVLWLAVDDAAAGETVVARLEQLDLNAMAIRNGLGLRCPSQPASVMSRQLQRVFAPALMIDGHRDLSANLHRGPGK